MKKQCILLAVAFSISIMAFTSSSVALAGEPIPGVDIYLGKIPGGIAVTTTTGPDGAYLFTGLAPGTYDLAIPGARAERITVGADGRVSGTVMANRGLAADRIERAEKAIMQAEATSALSQVMTTRGRLQTDTAPPIGPPSSDSPLPGIGLTSSNDKEGTVGSSIAMSGSGSDDTGQPGVAINVPIVITSQGHEVGLAVEPITGVDTVVVNHGASGISDQGAAGNLSRNNVGIARAQLARARKVLADGEYGEAFRLARSAEMMASGVHPRFWTPIPSSRGEIVEGAQGNPLVHGVIGNTGTETGPAASAVGPTTSTPIVVVMDIRNINDPPIAVNAGAGDDAIAEKELTGTLVLASNDAIAVTVNPINEAPKQLENLMDAYRNRRMDAFLGFFAPDFRGNRDEIRRNAERDWALFHNIDISVMPMRVIPINQNVEIEFDWRNNSRYGNGTAAQRQGRSRIEFRPGAAQSANGDRWLVVAVEGDPFLGVGLDLMTRPRLVSYSPRSGQSGVGLNEAVVFDFSEDMDPGSLRFALTIEPAIDLTYDAFGRRYTVKPQSAWRANTEYRVRLSNAATDRTGASLDAYVEFTFRTIGDDAMGGSGAEGSPDAGSPSR